MMKNFMTKLIINHHGYKTTNKFAAPKSASEAEKLKYLFSRSQIFRGIKDNDCNFCNTVLKS